MVNANRQCGKIINKSMLTIPKEIEEPFSLDKFVINNIQKNSNLSYSQFINKRLPIKSGSILKVKKDHYKQTLDELNINSSPKNIIKLSNNESVNIENENNSLENNHDSRLFLSNILKLDLEEIPKLINYPRLLNQSLDCQSRVSRYKSIGNDRKREFDIINENKMDSNFSPERPIHFQRKNTFNLNINEQPKIKKLEQIFEKNVNILKSREEFSFRNLDQNNLNKLKLENPNDITKDSKFEMNPINTTEEDFGELKSEYSNYSQRFNLKKLIKNSNKFEQKDSTINQRLIPHFQIKHLPKKIFSFKNYQSNTIFQN